jgi:hypothetical protein
MRKLMKINELISALREYDGDSPVYILDGYDDYSIKWVQYYSEDETPHIPEGFYIRLKRKDE